MFSQGLGRTTHRAALVLLPVLVAGTSLPYNPTQLHLLSDIDGSEYLYILQSNSTSAELSYIDLSSTITAASLNATTFSTSPPFASGAFTSFLDSAGNITVIAGDCSDGINGAGLWRLTPDPTASAGGTWHTDKISTTSGLTGANYLSSGFAYSEVVNSNVTATDLYVFGGMCPNSAATSDDWVSEATYTNDMVIYSPQTLETDGDEEYSAAAASSKSAPIAEAGMAMVALTPSYSNSTAEETQTQDFVFLGGHTSSAFINMSQVALFSLPQASWAFLTVSQPDGATSVSDADYVTPRSGHTAVLSEDGTKIIVFGGWVSDVDTPATPLMAILNVGSGYGGSGSWEWETASPSGTFGGSDGIYGHGAVMLPGNIMMIAGGYSISSSSSRLRRRDTVAANSDVYLYNITSNSWVTTYDAASATSTGSSSSGSSSSSLSSSSQKAGVGVGVTFGVFALVGAGVFYAMKNKRQKRQKTNRDSTLLVLRDEKPAFDDRWNDQLLSGGSREKLERAETPTREAFPWLPDLAHPNQSSPAEGGATGAFINVPSPTRGLRRGANKGYQYTPAAGDEHGYRSSVIDTISEADEENPEHTERRLTAAQTIFDSGFKRKREDDEEQNPFDDPQPLNSHPLSDEEYDDDDAVVSPLRPVRRLAPALILPTTDRSMQNTAVMDWASSRDSAESRSSGRVSPLKVSFDGRRSDGSVSPVKSSYEGQRSTGAVSPNKSSSSGDRSSGNISPTKSTFSSRTLSTRSAQSFASIQPIRTMSTTGHRRGSEDPFGTPRSRLRSATSPTRPAIPERSPARPMSRAMGWVGSLRRALGTYTLEDATYNAASSNTLTVPRITTPSPTRTRVVSDSTAFLASKRGQHDWGTPSRASVWDPFADARAGDWGEPVEQQPKPKDDDWDVESAAAGRDFQVMFSLPKARLRVVNADPEKESIRSVSGEERPMVSALSTRDEERAMVSAQSSRMESAQSVRSSSTLETDEEMAHSLQTVVITPLTPVTPGEVQLVGGEILSGMPGSGHAQHESEHIIGEAL